jgi:hypothetical protein
MNMTLTQNVSLEEQIRHFYLARDWLIRYDLPMRTANHQETPNIAWDMPGLLSNCGVRLLVKAILPYECPWVARLEEPPLFIWKGVDNSTIFLRRRNQNYVEGNFVLEGLDKTNQVLHERILAEYESYGPRYPFDAISLLGCYGDLIPYEPEKLQSKDLPALKFATIRAYNNQGWEFPRLVNSSHPLFLDDIENQISARELHLEQYKGDYGLGWDAWPSCLAYDAARWRRAQARAGLADTLAALLSVFDHSWFETNQVELGRAWHNLLILADHAWNGANDANRDLNFNLRRTRQQDANTGFDNFIRLGIHQLAEQVPGPAAGGMMVFNSFGWERTGLVRLEGMDRHQETLCDLESEELLPIQWLEEDGASIAYVTPKRLPSIGYRVLAHTDMKVPSTESPWITSACRLEGPFYIVEVSPQTGGIIHLIDKCRGIELVAPQAEYHLNQPVYTYDRKTEHTPVNEVMRLPSMVDPIESTPTSAQVEISHCGPVLAKITTRSTFANIQMASTITLYTGIDQVDISNTITMLPTNDKQELHFAFPLNVPDAEVRYETPGAIVDPQQDYRPGAGKSAAVVRNFVDLYNQSHGVTLSLIDTFLVQFGMRSTCTDPVELNMKNGMIWALVMGNLYDANEAIQDQGGQREFTFRFSLRSHEGGYDPVSALRFAWESSTELLGVPLQPNQTGYLPGKQCSFVTLKPASAILTCLKPAEEQGIISRIWECSGLADRAQVSIDPVMGVRSVVETDLLERDCAELTFKCNTADVPLHPLGVTTMRLRL